MHGEWQWEVNRRGKQMAQGSKWQGKQMAEGSKWQGEQMAEGSGGLEEAVDQW